MPIFKQKEEKPIFNKIIGDSGTQRYSGYFMEEYNSKWDDNQRITTVEEMRRSDATVKGVLRAIKAPIMSANWSVSIDSEDEKLIKIKDFVECNLFGMQRTWLEFLKEALAMLDFGFYTFEEIWVKKDGWITLYDLEPRIPNSILRWQTENGEKGITQLIRTSDSQITQASIPFNKLLILTNEKEGDDLTGQSILRSAYKHYTYKDMLYRIQGISAERFGCGIPVITLGEGAGTEERSNAVEMAKNLRSNEEAYLVLPNESWKVEILTPNNAPQSGMIENAIKHHDKQIVFSILANFLQLGTDGGSGSYALSQDQSSFFLQVVENFTRHFAEQINKQVIKRLVDYNFGEQEIYPQLTFSKLGNVDYSELSESLSKLVNVGLVDVDAKLKQSVRRDFNLPELTEEQLSILEEEDIENEMNKILKNYGPTNQTKPNNEDQGANREDK